MESRQINTGKQIKRVENWVKIVYRQVIGPDQYFEINEEQLEQLVSRILEIPQIEEQLRQYHEDYLKLKNATYGTELNWPDGSTKLMSHIAPPCEKQLIELAIEITGSVLGEHPGAFAAMKRIMGVDYKIKEYSCG